MISVQIDKNHKNAQALLEYLKSLDFVKVDDEQEINQWQKEKLDELLDARKLGELELLSWDEAKKELSQKFKA